MRSALPSPNSCQMTPFMPVLSAQELAKTLAPVRANSAGWFGLTVLAFTVSASFAAVQPSFQLQALSQLAPFAPVTAVIPVAAHGLAAATTTSAGVTKIAAATGDIPKPAPSAKTDQPSVPASVSNPVAGKSAPQNGTSSAPQSKPLWADLTPAQQLSLKPLAANWTSLSEAHKRKWIAFAQNYPKMTPADQSRLHSRMTEWANLSPQQRTQARLNFAETKKLSADEKVSTWQAYQALTPEEKSRLANQGNKVPPGATSAVKPAPAQKLAVVPSTRKDPKAAQIAAHHPKVAPNTLLPHLPGSDTGQAASKD